MPPTKNHSILSQTHSRHKTTRIPQPSPKGSAEVGPGQGRQGRARETENLFRLPVIIPQQKEMTPCGRGEALDIGSATLTGPMLQFRHQTKQLCVVDVAHSIHLILGSSNKPIEVAPANPPNSPHPSTGPSSTFPTLGLPARLLPV